MTSNIKHIYGLKEKSPAKSRIFAFPDSGTPVRLETPPRVIYYHMSSLGKNVDKIVDRLLAEMPTNDPSDNKYVKIDGLEFDTFIIKGRLIFEGNYQDYFYLDTIEQGAGSVINVKFSQTSAIRDTSVSFGSGGTVYPQGLDGTVKCIVGKSCSFEAYPEAGNRVKDLQVDIGSGYESVGPQAVWPCENIPANGVRRLKWEFE